MACAKTTVHGRAPLVRNRHQWMLEYLIQETGKVFYFQSVWSSTASGHEIGLLKSGRGD
jgi:hypothetical protein